MSKPRKRIDDYEGEFFNPKFFTAFTGCDTEKLNEICKKSRVAMPTLSNAAYGIALLGVNSAVRLGNMFPDVFPVQITRPDVAAAVMKGVKK